MNSIPYTHFHASHIASAECYDVFRDSISRLFGVEADKENRQVGFFASIDAYLFNLTLITKCQSKSADYTRTRKKVQQVGNALILLSLHSSAIIPVESQSENYREF